MFGSRKIGLAIALVATGLARAQTHWGVRAGEEARRYDWPVRGMDEKERRAKLSSKGQSSYGPTKGRLKG